MQSNIFGKFQPLGYYSSLEIIAESYRQVSRKFWRAAFRNFILDSIMSSAFLFDINLMIFETSVRSVTCQTFVFLKVFLLNFLLIRGFGFRRKSSHGSEVLIERFMVKRGRRWLSDSRMIFRKFSKSSIGGSSFAVAMF